MNESFSDLLQRLRRARRAEEVFGPLNGGGQATLKQRYRLLAAIAHPDHNPTRGVEAKEAFLLLQTWYAAAQSRLKQGDANSAPLISAETKLHQYVGYERPLQGDLCELYPVAVSGERVLLKVSCRPRDNDLLEVEAQTLRRLDRGLTGKSVRAHFPTLVEDFLLGDADGNHRRVNVLRAEVDYVSLEESIRAYPRGLAVADAAWIFNRMLAALGVGHSLGIVHGAVVPAHVLIRPRDHNGMLIDWCYSVATGEAIQAVSPPYVADYPPEVHARQAATAATDIYMAARTMVRLLGGTDLSPELPPGIPKPLVALLRACLLPSPQRRASDAWQVFDDFQKILKQLYGPPTFRPFHMPSAA